MKTVFSALLISLGASCIVSAPVYAQTLAQSEIYGVAAPACESQTQLALNFCAARWSKTADFLRSLVYEDIARNLRTEPRKIQLKAIEQTWTSYRETHCKELTEPFRKGSIYGLLYHSCFARVANDRIADLQGQNNSQLTPDVTIQRLSKILSQANLSNSSGQRQWQTYQAQHCQFES